MQKRMWRQCVNVGLVLSLSLASAPVLAEPANARLYKNQFGYMPGCNACHSDGGGSPLNQYGKAFEQAGANAAAFAAIASQDADGDGANNAVEAQNKANPGSADSTPSKPGNWLDLSNLIPREVREAFPEVRLYKPIDAILTGAEIERAAAWGVTLAASDENTIYVPVQERRPVGTAVIVPGRWQQQKFFLLVTTDRQFKAARVIPIASEELPVAGDAAYTALVGASAQKFPAAEADTVAGAIAAAAHKALALITVRLTKS